MKIFLGKMAPGFVGSLIIVILGLYINNIREKKSNQKRHIDCFERVVFNGLDSTELNEHNFQVLYNGGPVHGVSTIDVELYNFADRDCENIKILIEITPKKGDSLQILEAIVLGPHRHTVGLKTIENNSKKTLRGSIRFEYELEAANRADSLSDVLFDANYGIISREEPTLKVTIQGKGLEKGSYSRGHYQKLMWWETDDAFAIFFLTGIILFAIIFIKIILYFDKKRNVRWQQYLLKHLAERVNNGKVNYDAQSIINAYSEINERFDYDDASLITRRLKRMKSPDDNIN